MSATQTVLAAAISVPILIGIGNAVFPAVDLRSACEGVRMEQVVDAQGDPAVLLEYLCPTPVVVLMPTLPESGG